jgi:catechol-2,3-dioxygenase
MAISIGQIILQSRRIEEMAQFLSELFEMEIYPSDDGEGVFLLGETFKISLVRPEESNPLTRHNDRDILIDFFAPTLRELEDILHKVQFLNYRMSEEKTSSFHEKASLNKIGESYYFHLRDPEGRKWKFSYRP